MADHRFALTANGRVSSELKDRFQSPAEMIGRRIGSLDGDATSPCACGHSRRTLTSTGTRQRLTVEIRRLEHGERQRFVLGHSGADSDVLDQVIRCSGAQLTVRATEVFDGAEALEIFEEYLASRTVSARYSLRRILL